MGKLRHGKGKLHTQGHPASQGQRCLSESKASYPHFHCVCQAPKHPLWRWAQGEDCWTGSPEAWALDH